MKVLLEILSTRRSFVYQLYELAIENRYIELDDIKQMVSDELTLLLWSDGARNYLETYGYASVIYLSQRVGIDLGIATGDLPDIRQGTEGRFASFLSQHALWYEDPVLDGWIGFLDDYQVLQNAQESDKAVFQEFLDTERDVSANDVTLWTFVAGADRFVTRVADLAASLSQDEKPSYGLFYAYWLAKFYGYRLTADGYVREPKMPDWSAALCNSKRIAHYNEIRKEVEGGTVDGFEAFRVRDRAVHEFWNNALQHLHNNVQQYGQSVRFGP